MEPVVAGRSATLLLATTLTALLAGPASALPVSWTVDGAQSPLAIEVTLQNALLGTRSGSGATTLGGGVGSDVLDPLGPSPSIALAGSGVTLADTSFAIALGGFFGTVTITYDAVGASLVGGPALGTPPGAGPWSLDLTGSVLTLDQGQIHANHFMMNQSFDLGVDPVAFVLGPTVATLVATDLGGGQVGLELLVPVDVTAMLDPIPAPIVGNVFATVHMTGQLRMLGVATLPPVPEPGTALLLGVGLAGLSAWGRRAPV